MTARRSGWRIAGALLSVAALGLSATWVVTSEVSLQRTRTALARATARLDGQHREARLAQRSLTTASGQLSRQRAAVRSVEGAAGATGQDVTTTDGAIAQQAQVLGQLQGCLSGVAGAYGSLTAGDLPTALSALDGSSSACLSVDGGRASGLVYPFDFPDPFVLSVNGTYYAYGTNSAAGNIQAISSTDLTDWTPVGDALPELPSWAAPGGGVWAPSVLQLGGTFVMYFSAVFATANEQCIGAATSSSPTGPFVDPAAFPIVCQLADGGSIDPSPFVDPAGGLYLDWKSQGANSQLPTIWAQQLAGTGTQLAAGGPAAILGPSQAWEHGWTEAPDMFWLDGQRYLFYSGSDWKTATYGIGVADCSGPLGPCSKPVDRPVLASGGVVAGPGGASAFTDVDGQPWVAFAAWLTGQVGYPHSRVLFLRPLQVVGGVPEVCTAPPSWTTGDSSSETAPGSCT